MTKHLERDIEALERSLLAMSSQVEAMMIKARASLEQADSGLAREVIEADEEVDIQEVSIEEECLKILALHQPVAIDLRRTATILKVNNDLERIADLAVNIAEHGEHLINASPLKMPTSLPGMADAAQQMLANSLTALVRLSADDAEEVCRADDQVDDLHQTTIAALVETMKASPDNITPALHYLGVARSLERIADLATNIAEDVIYLVRGDIARHRMK